MLKIIDELRTISNLVSGMGRGKLTDSKIVIL